MRLPLLILLALPVSLTAGGAVFNVPGNGNDDTSTNVLSFAARPNAVYCASCRVRHHCASHNEGVAVVGMLDCNDYIHIRDDGWVRNSFVVQASEETKKGVCNIRQWHLSGVTEFADLEVAEVSPVYRRVGDVLLGSGESVEDNDYRFALKLGDPNHGHSRALESYRKLSLREATQFAAGSEMRFSHALGERELQSGCISLVCKEGASGRIVAEVSDGGGNWIAIAAVTNMSLVRKEIPRRFFPAKRIEVRVRGEGGNCDLKLRQYAFDATFSGAKLFGFGATEYRRVDDGREMLSVKSKDYLDDVTSGALLPATPKGVAAWEQSSGRKVFRGRPAPLAKTRAMSIAAARNEAEAKQLVLRPDDGGAGLSGVKVEAEIDGEIAVEVLRVGYQFVDFAPDGMGARGYWPDPLFPQTAGGVDIQSGQNQPFWVRVKPAKTARAGVHRGKLRVSAKGIRFEVPLEVEVFGFSFPDRTSCDTSFGLNWQTVYKYHHLKTAEQKRAVVEKYLAHFADHHISPYHPFPLVTNPSWTMKWTRPENPRDAEPVFDWRSYDAEVERVLSKYHFNSFVFSLRDLGGGDYEGTQGKANMNGAPQGSELYEIYAERYLKAVEAHLREKGWLDTAYAYVYDEPRPEHYAYVNDNLARIARYAPQIRRMVTVEPRAEFGDNINLWCPITERFERDKARERLAKGDQVWWYITDYCREPKVNEHIEHSGVDMRVWLWQTWRERLGGVLIWETVYWNNSKVYPDPLRPQNPHVDSLCWGGRRPWNTGEGRYVYPPLACFETSEPVLEGPVDSIRFEMLREGIEDYEYFAMLKALDPKSPLLAVPDEVARSSVEYSLDPAAMESHRIKLAKAIVKEKP